MAEKRRKQLRQRNNEIHGQKQRKIFLFAKISAFYGKSGCRKLAETIGDVLFPNAIKDKTDIMSHVEV